MGEMEGFYRVAATGHVLGGQGRSEAQTLPVEDVFGLALD